MRPHQALTVAALLFAVPVLAGAPAKRTPPLESITVKLMPGAAYAKRAATADPTVTRDAAGRLIPTPWLITSVGADSCVAWVNAAGEARDHAMLAAFQGCRAAIAKARLAASRCHEDEPCWDCRTMGNRICGPAAPAGGAA